VPALPANVATVKSPTIAARTRKPDLVVTRTSTPPGGFATCGIADVATPGARETPRQEIPPFSGRNGANRAMPAVSRAAIQDILVRSNSPSDIYVATTACDLNRYRSPPGVDVTPAPPLTTSLSVDF